MSGSRMVREDSDVALEASHFAFLQQNKNILANNVLWKRKVRFHSYIFNFIEYIWSIYLLNTLIIFCEDIFD